MRKELQRKAIHFTLGNAVIASVLVFGTQNTLLGCAIVLLAGLIVSRQLQKGKGHPLLDPILRAVERKHETRLPGKAAILFFLGTLITLFLFKDPIIAAGAIIVLTYGDAAASLIGKSEGRFKLSIDRTLEGTLGGITVAFLALFFLLPTIGTTKALIAAIVGMLAEFLPIDDNLSIPIAAGIALSFLI
jgi:dolichol kinase